MIDNGDGVGFVEQSYTLSKPINEVVFTLSADIKSKNLIGKGAGLNITVYDSIENILQSVDMGYGGFNSVTGTSQWKTKSIKTILTSKAKIIKIGLISYGQGTAYFDNVEVSFDEITDRRPSALAKDYIDKAGDSIMMHSLLKNSINIEPIKEKAYNIAGDAKTGAETYLAIEYMLNAIEDKHAFFMPADARENWEGNTEDNNVDYNSIKYSKSEIKEGLGYISVPGFHGNNHDLRVAFADTIQKQIQTLYAKKIKGFIVDLRLNDGGNMSPMLAGLAPLFSTDTLGFLIDVNNKREYWGNGNSFKRTQKEDYTASTIQTVLNKELPIAVLYGSSTGSSGEIIIISFIGNAKTKSFGQPSYGLTTGNGEYRLPDGSYLFFSSTYMADRKGTIYKSRIIPDEVIEDKNSALDEVLKAAITWLKTQ
ncbi:S41 family peptidase [Lacinutrix neustonica]|uniref:S41 family peptidase n=1 Tax=Lacinutrix neustonica TaxID=2980107 RepID=A0A9E8MWF5_9FLAO|nr:S41 family peptidase [Lacinutrix neustonica]WAC02753.1 S41 family peptidase [Lacinutrix neustonica]